MDETLHNLFARHELLAGGGLLMLFGAFWAFCRSVQWRLWGLLDRHFVTTIEVDDRDDPYFWMRSWLARQPYSRQARRLTATTRNHRGRDDDDIEEDEDESADNRPNILFSPAPGSHILRYRGHLLLFHRERHDTNANGQATYRESMTIRTMARPELVRRLLDEARDVALPPGERKISVMTPCTYGWSTLVRRPARDIGSVVLPNSLKADLLDDVRLFSNSARWYHDLGIPYRRGYLLYGPPGNGKSSLVFALAGELGRTICMINLREPGYSDARLFELMVGIPKRSMVLFEDVDCAFAGRKAEGKISLSGLLNAIDGITSPEGQVLILTTNHPERLDPALTRPGRVDKSILLDNATREQATELFLRFHPNQEELAEEFSRRIGENTSMATLQGHLLRHRIDPKSAARFVAETTRATTQTDVQRGRENGKTRRQSNRANGARALTGA